MAPLDSMHFVRFAKPTQLPFNAALRRVKECGIEKRISDRPHAMYMLWLFNICIVSWHVCQLDLVYAISEA